MLVDTVAKSKTRADVLTKCLSPQVQNRSFCTPEVICWVDPAVAVPAAPGHPGGASGEMHV